MLNGLIVLNEHAFELIYGSELYAEIARRVHLVAPPQTGATLQADSSILRDVDVIFSGWGAPLMDEAFLAAAPRLRVVFYGAGTIRGFVTDAFWAREIVVTSAYAANAVPVSEYTVAAILFSLKHGWRFALGTKRLGRFPEHTVAPGAYGTRVGLISLGTIGRLVRERLRPFDLHVSVHDPFLTAAQAKQLDVQAASLEEVFQTCDVVSLHAPWLKETEGMIKARHFEVMKPGATFINTARGAIVQEDDLIRVFQQRPDLTAVLDVTHPEPPAPDSPLFTLPNVVLTPHIAGSSDRECRRMGRLMIDEFERWIRGEPLKWSISRERAAIMA
ncbi:MAG TPA: hydroxyacid dehydrogenase [Opitutaceae bacterium]